MIERIKHWVVVMFENRSFDNLLGHLPHIDAEDSIRDREILLPYPNGVVRVAPSANFTDPIPDPGEAYPSVNVQLFGRYLPEVNAGRAPYAQFPDFMTEPWNNPAPGTPPTMDGFALDFFNTARWQLGRELSDQEMASVGAVFTPDSAPVINTLAQQYAVFTRWFCDVPTCTFPNRTFFLAGTSGGRLDNDITWNYAWDNDLPNLFDRFTDQGKPWKCYYPKDQVVPLTAVNLAGARHLRLWREHTFDMPQFYADAANGTLPTFSWVEPAMQTGDLDDYHPPTDIRAAENLLARLYNAVRTSPQWESTALVVMFDEHGGCYDHVPPPHAVPPGDETTRKHAELGFGFDRLGVRVPTIVISPYTARGTVIRDVHSNTSMTRSLVEQCDLGPAFTARDANARPIDAAFNQAEARRDLFELQVPAYVPGGPNPHAQQPVPGDLPDVAMWKRKELAAANQYVSQLGEYTLRNAARLLGETPDDLPTAATGARRWLTQRFVQDGRLHIRQSGG